MDALTLFGLAAVTAMLVFYALEDRNRWYSLAFAGACALGSVYGFLQGAWPFALSRPFGPWWRRTDGARGNVTPRSLRRLCLSAVARVQGRGFQSGEPRRLTFRLTSANNALHAGYPEVVLGPGAICERVGFFAFSRDSRQGPASTGRRDGVPRLSALRVEASPKWRLGEWLA
jgi:hypothetical protein